jgi:hypothetical protein
MIDESWLSKVVVIFNAQTNDLNELARLVGYEPAYFYHGTDFSETTVSPVHSRVEFSAPFLSTEQIQRISEKTLRISSIHSNIADADAKCLRPAEWLEASKIAHSVLDQIDAFETDFDVRIPSYRIKAIRVILHTSETSRAASRARALLHDTLPVCRDERPLPLEPIFQLIRTALPMFNRFNEFEWREEIYLLAVATWVFMQNTAVEEIAVESSSATFAAFLRCGRNIASIIENHGVYNAVRDVYNWMNSLPDRYDLNGPKNRQILHSIAHSVSFYARRNQVKEATRFFYQYISLADEIMSPGMSDSLFHKLDVMLVFARLLIRSDQSSAAIMICQEVINTADRHLLHDKPSVRRSLLQRIRRAELMIGR